MCGAKNRDPVFLSLYTPDEGEELEEAASAVLTRDYHCPVCGDTKKLSSIGILKHKRIHAQQQQQRTGQ